MSSSVSFGSFFDGCDDSGTSATSEGWASAWDVPRLAVGGSASNATDEITEPDSAVSENEACTSKPVAQQGEDGDVDIRRHSGASKKTSSRSVLRRRRSVRLSGEVIKARTSDVAAEVLTFCIQKDEEKKDHAPKERTAETRPLSPEVKKIFAKPAVWVDPFKSSDPKMRRDYIAYCTTCELWLGDESDPNIRRKVTLAQDGVTAIGVLFARSSLLFKPTDRSHTCTFHHAAQVGR
ncbi:hypothetical protein DFP72DRAFT_840634 [Ephemerocybe angulata]|uniref:Uncharacterized protein n=1 Tax=Ephemerocybe angulata TaxID=980116 RepID=A0A8H6MDK6_9AGAR|nr:hypothetical protein DFP72DRAFT_840634 [Tulosesus angulatus]